MRQNAEWEAGAPPISYEKVFVEKVDIRLNAPEELGDGTSGRELLHGYLCDIYRLRSRSADFSQAIDLLCQKWNVTYVSG